MSADAWSDNRHSVHYSSAATEWITPPEIFDPLHEQYGFELDVCALDQATSRCPRFLSPRDDGLKPYWNSDRCWMNPPYGRAIGDWIRRAAMEGLRSKQPVVVALVPARTDTRWWQRYAVTAHGILFLAGRARFISGKTGQRLHGAPFPSAILVWNGGPEKPRLDGWWIVQRRETQA